MVIAEHASNVVFTAGPDHRVMWVSPNITRILGWPAGDLVGHEVEELAHPDDVAGLSALLQPCYEGSDPSAPAEPLAVRVRARTGALRWVEVAAATLRDVDGTPGRGRRKPAGRRRPRPRA